MTGQSHLFGGTLIGVSYMISTNFTMDIPFTIGSLIGSIFPDIDEGTSKISNKVPLFSFVTRLFVGHRGIIHTPVFLIILSIIIQSICTVLHIPEHFIFGFVLGFLCHLFQDTMTRRGIKWLYPVVNKSFHIMSLRSGRGLFYGLIEMLLTILIVGILMFPIISLGGIITWIRN